MLAFLEMITNPAEKSKCRGIFEQYSRLMYYVAEQILHDPRAAEDAVQQAFIKLIRSELLQKINEIDCPKTKSLMVIIVRRVALDIYNRRKKRGEAPLDTLYETGAEDVPGEDGVTAAILRLPALYAETLELRYVQGFSAKETAKLLGLTEAAVQKRLTRGKELLRESLEKEGYHVPG